MLGRQCAERLQQDSPESLFADDVIAAAHEADLFVLNLECCISDRGQRFPDPFKPFFFRAPPVATKVLTHLGAYDQNIVETVIRQLLDQELGLGLLYVQAFHHNQSFLAGQLGHN